MRSHRGRGATLPRQWSPRPTSKTEDRSVTWFHPLWRHGLQQPDFQIERGGVSQTGALVLRSDNDPEPDERITVTGQRIGQRVRQRCQEPKNDFLSSMCPKWVPNTLSASQIRTYDERVRNPTRALMAAGTPVFSTSRDPSFSGHFYQVVARSPDLATWPTEGLQPQARRETYGPAAGGVWRPAPNRQLEIRKLFPARSLGRTKAASSK